MASAMKKEGGASEETFSLELPAPPGWKKQIVMEWDLSGIAIFHAQLWDQRSPASRNRKMGPVCIVVNRNAITGWWSQWNGPPLLLRHLFQSAWPLCFHLWRKSWCFAGFAAAHLFAPLPDSHCHQHLCSLPSSIEN